MNLHLHHIAVLTESLTRVEESLPAALERLEVEVFPKEGTKEQYIDLSAFGRPSLLLIEAIGDGPYKAALQKRGVGLHHFGLIADHLGEAADHFARHRLLVHPATLKTLKSGVIWMCRPGIPFLLEIVGVERLAEPRPPEISMAAPGLSVDRIDWIPGLSIIRADDSVMRLSTGSASFQIVP